MDNKQKKKLYSLVYTTIFIFVTIALCFAFYLCVKNLANDASAYIWLDISVIIAFVLTLVGALVDAYKTKKMQNKYVLAKYLYAVITLTILFLIVLAVFVFNQKAVMPSVTILEIALILTAEIGSIFMFAFGLKLSKLYQNTTITLDSTSETPNYNDEINLKKKLNELNRKLEIKKLQEQIANAEKELDEK